MVGDDPSQYLAGVVEGFYGPPWTQAERCELFDWMARWGLNTYLYAPKDDLKHRGLWRELYSPTEAAFLRELIQTCERRGIRFIYALSPGLDIRYRDPAEGEHLRNRCAQMLTLGCHHFALLFDDVPDRPDTVELRRAGRLAVEQGRIANELFRWLRQMEVRARFLFCPAPYCGRMVEEGVGGTGYLAAVGRELSSGIDVLWTGPEIVSREIPEAHLREVQSALCRKPVLWDNLYADDYDGRRFFCGPYSGRAPGVRAQTAGLLINPNNEFPLNFVPLHTVGAYLKCGGTWDAREAYLVGMREWWSRFATVGAPIALDDLIQFGDCYYLPHEDGPEAKALFENARRLLSTDPGQWGPAATPFLSQVSRLSAFCGRMPELRDRTLLHALSRRVWELREELDLLERFVRHQSSAPGTPFRSGFHLPGTYRGGLVPRLQQLLTQHDDGTFTAASEACPRREPHTN